MADPLPPSPDIPDTFEARTQIVVRALLAVGLVSAYIAFLAFGVETPQFLVGLVGVAAGFFLGAAKAGVR